MKHTFFWSLRNFPLKLTQGLKNFSTKKYVVKNYLKRRQKKSIFLELFQEQILNFFFKFHSKKTSSTLPKKSYLCLESYKKKHLEIFRDLRVPYVTSQCLLCSQMRTATLFPRYVHQPNLT